jgi:hypothetical protein
MNTSNSSNKYPFMYNGYETNYLLDNFLPPQEVEGHVPPHQVETAYDKRPVKSTNNNGITLPEKYAIWEGLYLLGMTFTEVVKHSGKARGTCHKYGRLFDNNPPMDAIKKYNPTIYDQLCRQGFQ